MRIAEHIRPLLSPSRPLLAGFGVLALFQAVLYVRGNPDAAQPIAFNHAKHVASGLGCTDCHTGAETRERATIPGIEVCMGCHATALSESAEEARLRSVAAAGEDLAWRQVTRVPAHVYFSHRRHVALAGLECSVCHGPMETLTAPPRAPFRVMSMDSCIECHRKSQVRAECNDCHR
jgi:menaquinone reductase, multiheme cytochrome c subunit